MKRDLWKETCEKRPHVTFGEVVWKETCEKIPMNRNLMWPLMNLREKRPVKRDLWKETCEKRPVKRDLMWPLMKLREKRPHAIFFATRSKHLFWIYFGTLQGVTSHMQGSYMTYILISRFQIHTCINWLSHSSLSVCMYIYMSHFNCMQVLWWICDRYTPTLSISGYPAAEVRDLHLVKWDQQRVKKRPTTP